MCLLDLKVGKTFSWHKTTKKKISEEKNETELKGKQKKFIIHDRERLLSLLYKELLEILRK